MAHLVESMFSVREAVWHGLGKIIQEAPTSLDALHIAGLDWTVNPAPIYDQYGKAIPNYIANTRSSDNSVLGIVTERYKVVQNHEAFAFTDGLLGEGVTYETAGSLANGRKIWLLAKMPETTIIDDAFVPYLVFTNSHDGTGSVKVAVCNTRVVCNNTLNIALAEGKRSWSTKHVGNIENKMEEAHRTILMAQEYMQAFGKEAEKLLKIKMNNEAIDKFIEILYPLNKEDSQRKQNNVIELRDFLKKATQAPDIANFKNTAYGMINAVTDAVGHIQPQRATDTFQERRFNKIIEGHDIVDLAYDILKKAM